MEFPSDDVDCFEATDFELAVPRTTGRTVMELMAQARPTGRVMDHYRIAMGGSAQLEANVVLSTLLPEDKLSDFKLVYNFWCRDVAIRRNMTTGKWMDLLTLISSNTVTITDLDGSPVSEQVLGDLVEKELHQHRAAIRHAVVVGPDQRMSLELQAMSATEAVLTSKPAFVG